MEKLVEGLNESAKAIHTHNVMQGFWDEKRNVGELLMLVVTEISEAMEAHRDDKHSNIGNWNRSHQEQLDAYSLSEDLYALEKNISFKDAIKDSFEDEIADAIIRLLDLCGGMNIDIEEHIRAKVEYNKSRPRLHGKKL